MPNLQQKIQAAQQRVEAASTDLSSAHEFVQKLAEELGRKFKVKVIDVDTEMNYVEMELSPSSTLSVSYGSPSYKPDDLRHIADCVDNAKGLHCEISANDSNLLCVGASVIDIDE